jgi:Asp-tRNA(Asn)/Glu-tRNA(Gln) amidotransferase A subunit family amidase
MAFSFLDASVASVQSAYATGELSCAQLTRWYLDRIEAYDRRGPELRSLITVNPHAMRDAEQLDRRRAAGAAGVLLGIPVILKDNFDTADMPTTGGCIPLKESRPLADAFTVRKMREAGALILAKANQGELARSPISFSKLGGQVRNPYDLTRNPGGSSGGTGSAIAAQLGLLGTGSDTGQSIRSPASACNLVGVRPTRGLVSRAGIMPNSFIQDEIGPITRNVSDAALMLDVMAGYDAADPITAFSRGHIRRSYAEGLRADALKGARIGVIENMFGTRERHREVNMVMARAMQRMEALGATFPRFRLEAFDELSPVIATSRHEAAAAWKIYFAGLRPDAPVKSLEQLVAANNCSAQDTLELELSLQDGMNTAEYKALLHNRDKLRLALAAKLAELNLDAVIYPQQRILVPPIATGEQPERNGALSHGTGFPAVTFPAGFSAPTATAPLGVPVGAEIMALDYTEPRLLAYAYAHEQAAKLQRLPVSTPAL